jgi:hypothetical protein
MVTDRLDVVVDVGAFTVEVVVYGSRKLRVREPVS